MLRNAGLLICGAVLVAGLAYIPDAAASGCGVQQQSWKQISDTATETIFLRRSARAVFADGDHPVLAAGDLIRTRPFLHRETASMTLFTHGGTGDTLELYPGSILAIDEKMIRLDLGRMRLVASGSPGLVVDMRRAIFELTAGEALIETDPRGNTRLALGRGTGWVKLADRRVVPLAPGKQIDIPRYGIMGQLSEAGHSWKTPPEFWLMPRPAETKAPETGSDEVETASEASLVASDTLQIASGSSGIAVASVTDFAVPFPAEPVASGSPAISE